MFTSFSENVGTLLAECSRPSRGMLAPFSENVRVLLGECWHPSRGMFASFSWKVCTLLGECLRPSRGRFAPFSGKVGAILGEGRRHSQGRFAPFSGKVRAILGEGSRHSRGRSATAARRWWWIGLRDLHDLSKLILPSRPPNTSNCHERPGCDDAEAANAEDLAHASDESLARVLSFSFEPSLTNGRLPATDPVFAGCHSDGGLETAIEGPRRSEGAGERDLIDRD
jgi:hypothetical protein